MDDLDKIGYDQAVSLYRTLKTKAGSLPSSPAGSLQAATTTIREELQETVKMEMFKKDAVLKQSEDQLGGRSADPKLKKAFDGKLDLNEGYYNLLLSLLQCGNKKLLENENNESNNSDFKISSNITIANNAQNPNVVKIKESHKSRKSKRDNKSQRTLLLTRNMTQLAALLPTRYLSRKIFAARESLK